MREKKIVLCLLCAMMLGAFVSCDHGTQGEVSQNSNENIADTQEAEEQGTEPQETMPQGWDASELYVTENTVASLTTPTGIGSCIVLYKENNRLLLATASHVTGKTENVTINETDAIVIDYWKSSDFDLAYLLVETEGVMSLEVAHPSVSAFNELQEDSYIHVLGIVAGENISREGTVRNCWIYMEDFGYHMLWGDVTGVQGGMSGGAVFDSQGRLVGMLCGSDGESEIAVLPVSIMEAEWKNSKWELAIDIFAD